MGRWEHAREAWKGSQSVPESIATAAAVAQRAPVNMDLLLPKRLDLVRLGRGKPRCCERRALLQKLHPRAPALQPSSRVRSHVRAAALPAASQRSSARRLPLLGDPNQGPKDGHHVAG